jgi:methyl-accepting chemotaxis protein
MLNYLLRPQSGPMPLSPHQNNRAGHHPSQLAAAIEMLGRGELDGRTELDDELRAAIERVVLLHKAREARLLLGYADFVGAVSETAIYVGWITHDVHEVATSTQSIKEGLATLTASASHIAGASQFCSAGISVVSQGTSKAASDLQETRESMQAIASQVGSIASRADELDEAVQRISAIVRTVEAISRQTDLLALNATIEAARAGESGRGFGVVAMEVKALSGNTAKATEEIRNRIAVLSAGMQAIRQVTVESVNAVSRGENVANSAQAEFETLGRQIGDIAVHLAELTQHVDQQHNATREIASSVTMISDKATKVRVEVDSSLAQAAQAEARAIAELGRASELGIAHHELITIQGEAVAWKRRLAATLVGLTKPSPENEVCASGKLANWYSRRTEAAILQDPNFITLKGADETAHASAKTMMGYIQRRDWDKASAAYVAAENAIARLIGAAAALFQAHGDAVT